MFGVIRYFVLRNDQEKHCKPKCLEFVANKHHEAARAWVYDRPSSFVLGNSVDGGGTSEAIEVRRGPGVVRTSPLSTE